MNVDVISKATGAVVQVGGDTVDLDAPSIVRLDIDRASIAGIERQGHDLVIRLASGETIRVVDFYPDGAAMPNDLVLREGDGRLWLAHADGGAARFSLLRELDDLMAAASAEGGGGSSLLLPAVLGGVAAVGGAVALAAGGGGDSDQRPSGGGQPDPDPGNGGTAPDRDPPAVPTASVRGDGGAVTGRGEAGATVTVRDATGAVLATAVVAADGSYAVTVTPPLVNGERLTVTQADAAGNVSPTATVQAPDLTAPAAPTASVDATGTTVTGRGEAGATVTVRDAAGAVLGTAVVAADGSYAVTLSPARADGTSVTVTQADAAGNASPAVTVATPDLAAPAAPTALIDSAGVQVAGTGEPGARVTVIAPGGATVGSAFVAADGRYALTLDPAQANGEALRVVQTDAAGNASPATTLAAPDLTAPAAPVANVAADGSAVTGAGEPGARVTVSDAAGTAIGTATVGADGQFSVALTPAQANGEALSVVQTDAAGNVSPTVALIAPDVTAPAAPAAALDATGTVVSGTGEPGARVSVRDGAGVEIGSATVGVQGSYVVVLATPQVDSQALTVTQVDAAGNVSPATPLVAPDLTAPGAPTASVAADGASIAGTGEAGATVTVRGPLGGVIATVVVAADGTYTVPLVPAQVDGEALSVRQTDPAGNASPVTTATAPDLVVEPRPDAPTATVSADGSAVTGVAGGGAAITLYDAQGNVIATGTAAADGSYSIALTPPRIDGETVRVTQTDAAGDVSPPASAIAPDLTAPAAPAATLDATGSVVTGTAEAGAAIVVRDADGTILGSGTANARGGFVVTLAAPQVDGGTLAVTQADAAGNVSPPTALATPDLIAPDAPLATVAADGRAVTGTGEPGTVATVRDPAGAIVGTATVAADGSYTVTLTPAQANGEALSVTLSDAAGNISPATAVTAPDITAPPAPAATLDASGSVVTGTGEAGATVTVSGPGGTLATTVVDADGRYVAILPAAQVNGEALTVTQTDAAGNASPATPLTAPDTIAPDAPVAAVSGDGTSVTGTGEAGATVTVTDAAGAPLGSAIVGADGRFTVPLTPAQANGGTVQVTQTDPAGNASPTVSAAAPDITPPAVPAATVNADGSAIVGTGEPGAQVSVTTAAGVALGTATVAADGSFTVALAPAQANGEALVVSQTDGAGNISPSLPLTAPDVTPPAAPVATVVAGGVALVGTGEPGARVTVTDAAGAPLGAATVAADGSFTVTLSPAQANGETVRVTQTDAAGNASPAASVVAPDLTAPAQPLATIAADGTTVTGSGEPGARVTVVGATGVPVGTATVASDGSFTVPLTPAQANGESLRVTQADAAGNVSPSLPLIAPDITPPAQPAATVDPTGTIVIGTGEPGATVTVRDAGGAALGSATVNAQGGFAVALSLAQVNAQPLSVVQADAAGNVSPPLPLVAPDLTPPAAPTATVGGDGLSLSGTGEAGANVTVRDPLGIVIGTGVVAADGSYTVTLSPAQIDGEVLSVVQADAAGNVSPAATATAPDVVIDTDPAAPTATVGADGAAVAGVALPGAAVTVYDASGAVIASGTAAPDGTYSVALTSAADRRRDGARHPDRDRWRRVAAGDRDRPRPDRPGPRRGATLDATGTVVTGTGEPGATVHGPRRRRPACWVPRVVTAGGAYAAVLTAAQTNGETLSVTQADRAGNFSPAASLIAADITAPGMPVVTIAADGASVAGHRRTPARPSPCAMPPAPSSAPSALRRTAASSRRSVRRRRMAARSVSCRRMPAGNVSSPATLAAPDITAPAVPTIVVAADGLVASGIGEPGAIVTITGAGRGGARHRPGCGRRALRHRAVERADRRPDADRAPGGCGGQRLGPGDGDRAGPDRTGCADAGGDRGRHRRYRHGRARRADRRHPAPRARVLGVATVAADGSFATTLASAQLNGERLTATQTDGGGKCVAPGRGLRARSHPRRQFRR
ncbi:MAG: Ig-like domain-containing protein [Sphingomonas taxi]